AKLFQVSREPLFFIERNQFRPAIELDVLDEQERGMAQDGIQQTPPQPDLSMFTRHNYIKDHGFVNKVREHARKCHQAPILIAESAHYVRTLHRTADIRELSAA